MFHLINRPFKVIKISTERHKTLYEVSKTTPLPLQNGRSTETNECTKKACATGAFNEWVLLIQFPKLIDVNLGAAIRLLNRLRLGAEKGILRFLISAITAKLDVNYVREMVQLAGFSNPVTREKVFFYYS